MIQWCSYCQHLIGERPPLTSYEISHGICPDCIARLEAGEPIVAENAEVVRFFRNLFAAGYAGDLQTGARLIERAQANGYGQAEVLMGLLQPGLAKIGRLWEVGDITYLDEHRFTSWCEAILSLLKPAPRPPGPLDILLLGAPRNQHVLGPRFAEQVMLGQGIAALCVSASLPIQDVLAQSKASGAAWIGYSCALPHQVAAALDAIEQLRRGGYGGSFMLSGQALRRSPELASGVPAQLVLTLDEACASIVAARPSASGQDRHDTSTPAPR